MDFHIVRSADILFLSFDTPPSARKHFLLSCVTGRLLILSCSEKVPPFPLVPLSSFHLNQVFLVAFHKLMTIVFGGLCNGGSGEVVESACRRFV